MCVKLNSLFDREMKVCVTQVLKQCNNIKTICPDYMYIHTRS